MGAYFHITRADFWADNDNTPIPAEEWLAYVASDPELKPLPQNGPYFFQWIGPSKHEEPWLNWSKGNVETKWPDTALYKKMLQVAQALKAQVQEDDGSTYRTESDWEFDPTKVLKSTELKRKTFWWWRFLRK